MATGKNTTFKKVATNMVISDVKGLLTPSLSLNEGDFVCLDTTNHVLVAPANETDGATLIGVMSVDIVNGQLRSAISTDVDASAAVPSIPGPTFGDEYLVVLKSGVTVHPGDPLYLDPGTGTRGVTTSGTKIVGIYTGTKNVVGDGTIEIPAKIGARAPADTLKF